MKSGFECPAYVAASDFMRNAILHEYGEIYIDTDNPPKQAFPKYRELIMSSQISIKLMGAIQENVIKEYKYNEISNDYELK